MYQHVSPVGTFDVKPDRSAANKWCLWLEDELLGVYPNPQAATIAVHAHLTGHADWDARYADEIPADLTHWTSGYWSVAAKSGLPRAASPSLPRRSG